jgi:hypothetical protein
MLMSIDAFCPIRIAGEAGVALDDLVYIMTRLARQAEEEGFDKVFAAAEEATRVMKARLCWLFLF